MRRTTFESCASSAFVHVGYRTGLRADISDGSHDGLEALTEGCQTESARSPEGMAMQPDPQLQVPPVACLANQRSRQPVRPSGREAYRVDPR